MNEENYLNPETPPAPVEQPAKGLALASFLCGLGSIVCCATPASVAGLILGRIAKKKGNTSGMRKAGIACSIAGIVLSVILSILSVFMILPDLSTISPDLFGDLFQEAVTTPSAHVPESETTRPLTVEEMLIYTPNGDGTYAIGVKNGCRLPTEVTIPARYRDGIVTAIATSGFMGQTSLRQINLPDTITSIGGSAFEGCRNLSEVELPDTVTSMGPRAFAECTSLEKIDIPEGITEIPDACFSGCSSLEKVTLPSTMTRISDLAFSECKRLLNIPLPDAINYIGDNAFNGCEMYPHITLPAEIKYIGLQAFFETNIASIFYQGTMEDWEDIVVKGENWCSPNPLIQMICTDGTIELRKE